MFLLDETTLFYHNINLRRSFDKSASGLIQNWATDVAGKAKGIHGKAGLTSRSSTLIARSVKAKPSTSGPKSAGVKISNPPAQPFVNITLSDEEWLRSDSPKRVTSAVSLLLPPHLFQLCDLVFRESSRLKMGLNPSH